MNVWVKRLLITLTVMTAALFALVGPINRAPLTEQAFYPKMNAQLDAIAFTKSSGKYALKAGWKKVSLTPEYPMPMAGYRVRENFESVHDSLYAHITVLHAGEQRIFLISVDLLLFPPVLKQQLQEYFKNDEQAPFIYPGATHTHNGIGGWHKTVVGNFVLGKYDERWVTVTRNKIIAAIQSIESNLQPASISYFESDAKEYTENRLKAGAPYDGWLRGIKLARTDSSTAYLITYSAHPTSISKKSKSLSGDYPAAIVDSLEKKTDTFAMFMAGMVGSHRLTGISSQEFDLVADAGGALSKKIMDAPVTPQADSVQFITAHIPIQFGPSQLRIAHNWKIRDWLFSWLVNPLEGELTYLQINDWVMIGTPCDFSGEIFTNHIAAAAAQQNKKIIITSFNGEYVGYITEDEHYEQLAKEEVMALNWVGPHFGAYFTEMITRLLNK